MKKNDGWVEFGGCWRDDFSFPEYPPMPDLFSRAPKKFKDLKKMEQWWESIDMEVLMLSDKEFKKKYPKKFEKRVAFRRLEKSYDTWLESQPEYIQWNKECQRLEKENEAERKGFVDKGLNKSGTLIETDEGKIFLIGDINELSGCCDDCRRFDDDTIIKRYKVVFEK